MRTTLFLGLGLILIAAGGMQIVSLHRTNTKLRMQVNERRASREASTPPPQANTGDAGRSSAATNEAVVRLTQLRAEVAALEKKATEHYAANSEETDAPSANRDPEKGMTRLENMLNVGQGTPAAALQTLFWAALKGEDQVMARTIGWDEAMRRKAQALIDRLPEELRARYSTPEQLAALFISKKALDVSAIHISETELKDAAHASLTVKGLTAADEHLPMRLGPNGWQYLVGEGMLATLTNELTGKIGN